jgi:rhodanese-related sulfurtransferase
MHNKPLLLVAEVVLLLIGLAIYWLWRKPPADAPALSVLPGYAREEWPAALQLVSDKFPDVPQLTTRALGEWLNDARKIKPVLLDARAEKEFAVSHLPNALHAADEEQALQALNALPKDVPVVVYCSIGYRSSLLAQKLKAHGYTNIQNLEGSIFMWANEGRALQRGTQAVNEVHPFDEKWGRLLERTCWAFEAR